MRVSRSRRPGWLAAGALFLFGSGSAFAQCSGDWICIDAVRESGNVELRAANLRDIPLTFTLKVRTFDMQPEGPEVVPAYTVYFST